MLGRSCDVLPTDLQGLGPRLSCQREAPHPLLIDPDTKRIFVLDWGQLRTVKPGASYESDDRYVFARLLQGLASREPARILQAGSKMIRTEALSTDARAELERDLKEACANAADNAELLRAVTSAFASAGVPFRSMFTVGMLEEFRILDGEGYLPPERFVETVGRHVRDLIVGHELPLAVLESLGLA